MFGKVKNWFVKTTNDLTPADIPKESVFLADGRLTPLEFLQAGDRLKLASKMFEWESASKSGFQEPTLDPKKQFLKAKTVSHKRLENEETDIEALKIDDGWQILGTFETHESKKFEEEEDTKSKKTETPKIKNFEDSDSDDDDQDNRVKVENVPDDHKRIYEVHITYDRHYLTPRFWLAGVDSKNVPLTKEQIMEEVMNEYREKTVTYDKQPHTGEYMVNIHPCKHANVLRSFAEQASSHGNQVRPDQSLFLFLKFIGSVMPSVEIDYTVEMEL